VTPLPLFDSVPDPDGPGPGIVAQEGDASEVKMRTVAARADGIRVLDRPGVMESVAFDTGVIRG
jgi:hypothetical protein